ncbi:MAG TPA: GNAT family N-acetyltransferase [Streptosporangiaceae bacterium]|nr:GNAT family N-acetyltransferase [Streptosporangiaceae bacterium]
MSADAVIRTEHLELAPLRESDAAEMAGVLGDPRLHEFTGGSPATADQLRDRFRRLAAGSGRPDEIWLNWIVRLRATGTAIGTVQATVTRAGDRPTASVAWVIGVPWQRGGYGSESAAGLVAWLSAQGATTITAAIKPGHAGSERVAERAGLTPTDRSADGERIWQLQAGQHG